MFRKWDKIPRLSNEKFHFSEKIDGTNACVIIIPNSDERLDPNVEPITEVEVDFDKHGCTYVRVFAQSRSRLIYPNEGGEIKGRDNYGFAQWVSKNAQQLVEELKRGYHYGEWFGLGINRGYDLDENRFALFNPYSQSEICMNVPQLGSFDGLAEGVGQCTDQLSHGSYISPTLGYPAEGMVVYAEKARLYWKIIFEGQKHG